MNPPGRRNLITPAALSTLSKFVVLGLFCPVVIAAALIPGCRATNTVSSNRPIDPNVVDMSYKVDNQFLASELRVLSAYEKVRNNVTFVQINVRNTGAGDLWYMWQAVWTDRNGMRIPVEPVTWTREVLAERQDGVIEFAAPTPNAYDWRVTLQKWNRGS